MKNMVRCKACGFLMEEGKYHECPACGVPEKMFEVYEDKVPAQRRKILKMHLHPVIVHAPQAFGFVLFVLGAIRVFLTFTGLFPELDRDYLYPGLEVMAVLLPLTILGGILSGLLDGKVRYKKLNTIMLKNKMMVGSLFLILSIGMMVVAFMPAFRTDVVLELIFMGLNAGAFACSVILGLWGAALNMAEMPGPWPKKKVAVKE